MGINLMILLYFMKEELKVVQDEDSTLFFRWTIIVILLHSIERLLISYH